MLVVMSEFLVINHHNLFRNKMYKQQRNATIFIRIAILVSSILCEFDELGNSTPSHLPFQEK